MKNQKSAKAKRDPKANSKGKYDNATLPLGTVLNNKYIVYKNISSGGYGIVYIAKWGESFYAVKEFIPTQYDLRTDNIEINGLKPVKLKFTSQEVKHKFTADLATFFIEAQVASRFNHPNVVKIVDVFEENNTAYMVMPLEKGLNLFGYIGNLSLQDKRMPEREVVHIATQVCDGLSFLHKQGFVHLDIKAGNVLIRPNGQAVILDLGSCRSLAEFDDLPRPAVTRGYAAPEIYNNKAKYNAKNELIERSDIDYRVDIYAFGALLKIMIEGNGGGTSPLIPAPERREIDASYTSERVGQTHYSLLRIVDKCMELKREKRYSSIEEVKRDLQAIKFTRKTDELEDYFRNILAY